MVSLKECWECGRRESKAGVLKSRRVLQPSGKYATLRLCEDCWEEVKSMEWDEVPAAGSLSAGESPM